MPVNPEPIAVCLTEWPWRCACGGLAPQGQSQCVVCQASSAAPTVRQSARDLGVTACANRYASAKELMTLVVAAEEEAKRRLSKRG